MSPPAKPKEQVAVNTSTMVIHSARGKWYFWLDCLVTVIAWCIFIYLFARGIASLRAPSSQGLALPGLSALFPTLSDITVYLIAMLLQACLLIFWASYNAARFQEQQRRSLPSAMASAQLLSDYGISPEALAQLRSAPISIIHHDVQEQIVRITHPASA